MKRTRRRKQPQTVAECWAWFWATKGASWEQLFAMLDAINAPYVQADPNPPLIWWLPIAAARDARNGVTSAQPNELSKVA